MCQHLMNDWLHAYLPACTLSPAERDKPPEDEGGTVPPGSKGFGGHCDQFGRDCRM
jgi:hypothetical protein